MKSVQLFLPPESKPRVICTGNSLEFTKACEELSWNHDNSALHRSDTDGIGERAVRRVKEGTSTLSNQGSMNKSVTVIHQTFKVYWKMEHPLERRHDTPFRRAIPLGPKIFYHPISTRVGNRLHPHSSKVFKGITYSCQMHCSLLQMPTSKDSKKKKWEFAKVGEQFKISPC